MEAKKAIRKEIFRRRKETDPASICKNSAKIWQKLFSLPAFQESDWIYLYIDCKNEVMTDGIIKEAFRLGKKEAAPKVVGEDLLSDLTARGSGTGIFWYPRTENKSSGCRRRGWTDDNAGSRLRQSAPPGRIRRRLL